MVSVEKGQVNVEYKVLTGSGDDIVYSRPSLQAKGCFHKSILMFLFPVWSLAILQFSNRTIQFRHP